MMYFLCLDRLVKRDGNTSSATGLSAYITVVPVSHCDGMAPCGLTIFFLRHRQACQKLRKNIISPHGLLHIVLVLYIVVIKDEVRPAGRGWLSAAFDKPV